MSCGPKDLAELWGPGPSARPCRGHREPGTDMADIGAICASAREGSYDASAHRRARHRGDRHVRVIEPPTGRWWGRHLHELRWQAEAARWPPTPCSAGRVPIARATGPAGAGAAGLPGRRLHAEADRRVAGADRLRASIPPASASPTSAAPQRAAEQAATRLREPARARRPASRGRRPQPRRPLRAGARQCAIRAPRLARDRGGRRADLAGGGERAGPRGDRGRPDGAPPHHRPRGAQRLPRGRLRVRVRRPTTIAPRCRATCA